MRFPSLPPSILGAAWTTSAYGAAQAIRLATNVVLARLLSPELFGIMLIINTARTGIELLSDFGIGQNVVKSENSDRQEFVDTAWTIQVIRGVALTLISIVGSFPMALLFDIPLLQSIVVISSLNFVFLGLSSVHGYILKRRLSLKRVSLYEIIVAVASAVLHISFAFWSPTIWALVFAGLASGLVSAILSHWLLPDMRHRFHLSKDYVREIFSFGKWIFVATLLYFAATNFDRIYLATALPIGVLGTYSLAKSLTEMISVLVSRLGDHVIFPLVAASRLNRTELRDRLTRARGRFLMLGAIFVAAFASASDILINVLYDDRYALAAVMVPVMAMATWFGILSTLSEAILLGLGRPVFAAGANAVKLLILVLAVPIVMPIYGLAAVLLIFILIELVRYGVLAIAMRGEGLSFPVQDLLLTLILFGLTVALRISLGGLGLGSGVEALWFGNGAWSLLAR